MAAALTPRVRVLLICDGIRESEVEEGVFHLRGARSYMRADSLPLRRRLRLFLVLSSPRPGRFPAYVKVIDEQADRTVYYGAIDPAPQFDGDTDVLPLHQTIRIRFPQAGRYRLEIWFFQETDPDVLKMEQSFDVLRREG
jgi:hypothetical protein